MSNKLILSVEDVSEMLKCAPSTVRERTRIGDLPGVKFGDDWVYPLGILIGAVTELAASGVAARRGAPPQTPPTQAFVSEGLEVYRPGPRARPTPNLDAFTPVGGSA